MSRTIPENPAGTHADRWILGANMTGAGSLSVAGAPWWGVALLLFAGSILWCLVRVLQAVMPHGSADRRAIILAILSRKGRRSPVAGATSGVPPAAPAEQWMKASRCRLPAWPIAQARSSDHVSETTLHR